MQTSKTRSLADALTTSQASALLGISLTSTQKMADRGELDAWTTTGGHRRISRSSVMSFLGTQTLAPPPTSELSVRPLKVLLAEDDPIQVKFFQTIINRFPHQTDLIVATDASTALIQLERHRPDVVMTDLIMKPFDGFHLIEVMQTDPAYYALDIIVCSAMTRTEAKALGKIPDWVAFYQKPLSPDRLLGYLDSMLTRVCKREGATRAG